MAEQVKVEGVYTIRIENGAALKEFERLNKQLLETRKEKAELNKINKAQINAERELEQTIKQGGVASKEQVQELAKIRTVRDQTNKQLAEATIVEKALSSQTRELSNDLGGLTANGTRFRDKMAGAFATALDGTTAFQQLGQQTQKLESSLQAINGSIDKNAKQIAFLNEQLLKGSISEEKFAEETGNLNREMEASKAASALVTDELGKISSQSVKLDEALVKLNSDFNAGIITQEQYKNGLRKLDEETKKASQSTEGFGAAFSKQFSGDNIKSNLASFATSYIGIGAAIYGVTSVLSSAAKISEEFEASQSNLAAILGATKNAAGEYGAEMNALTNDAKNFGATTAFTASQVLELQTELAKLGFDTTAIRAATPAVLDLAAATGTDLANAATIAAQTLNAFQLPATETARIVDVIAQSANLSAFDIDTFSAAMSNAAPAAKAVGVEVEEAAALLSLLVDAGIPAEKAGTDLRNIFIELEANGLTMKEAFEQINGSQNKLTTSTELFGKRSGSSGIIIADNTDKLGDLKIAYGEAEGAAAAMARTQLDNLKGDKLLLTSAWEGFVLSVNDGSGIIGRSLRVITNGLTDVLGALTTSQRDNSIKTFAEEVDAQYKKLGGTSEIAAGAVKMFGNELRLLVDSSKELTPGADDIELLGLNLNKAQEALNKARSEGSKIQEAIALTAVNSIQAEISKRTQLVETVAASTAEIEKEGAALDTIGAKRTKLESQLKAEQEYRDELLETDGAGIEQADKKIRAIQREIDQLDGKAEKVAKESKAQKEANELIKKRIELAKELAAIATAQNQTPQQREEQAATNTRDERVAIAGNDAQLLLQIEVLYQVELAAIRKQYADEYIATLTSAEGGLAAAKQASAGQEFAALQKKHAAELAEIEKQGGDVAALLARHAQEQTTFVVESRSGEESALTAAFDAEYNALDGNLIAQFDRTEQYEIELAALRAKYREEDAEGAAAAAQTVEDIERQKADATLGATTDLFGSLQGVVDAGNDRRIQQQDDLILTLKANLENANTQAEKDQIQAQIDSAKKEKGALEKRKKDQKGFAIAAALINTYLAASSAFATTTPQYPAGVIAAAAAVVAGLSMVAKISEFAHGGEVGKQEPSGTVTSSWGTRVTRPNGDNVLVRTDTGMATLKTGEKVLNQRQQKALEDRVGPNVWGAIGLPGHTYEPFTLRPRQIYQQAFADGGVVGIVSPRPSSSTIVQNQLAGSIERISERPTVVDVREIVSSLDRVATIKENTSLG